MKTPMEYFREQQERYTEGQKGAVGYMLAWAMGVPASILFIIFLLRGCN